MSRDGGFFHGIALVLAEFVRMGQQDAVRALIAKYEFSYDDFVDTAHAADLAALRDVLPGKP